MSGPDTASRSRFARLTALRARVRSTRGGRLAWRVGVTFAGVVVVAVGIVLLAIPGPGWLIIFAGLGILATEYEWAKRLLRFARRQVLRWTDWLKRQSRFVQVLVGAASVIFLVAVVSVVFWFAYLR